MNWYWRVRIHSTNGQYAHAEIRTARDLREIDAIQDAYQQLTGCKMLLEGMSDMSHDNHHGFHIIWKEK